MAGTGDTSIRTYNFHIDSVLAGAGTYVDNGPFEFIDEIDGTPFLCMTMQFVNDGAAEMFFSFDGINDHGRVIAGETLTQPFRRAKRIWLRGVAANAFRFWAW